MRAVTLRAHFDGEQIRLDDPFPLEPDTPLAVMVLPKELEDEDREDLLLLSARGLQAAFDEDEPEYSLGLIKDPNPAYEGR